MNIEEATQHLFHENKAFQERILEPGLEVQKLKIYRGRFRNGDLGVAASIRLLEEFGYEVEVKIKKERP